MLIMALMAGLIFPSAALSARPLLIYILMALMTFSLMNFSVKDLLPVRALFRPILSVFLLNYLLFGILLLGVAWVFVGSDSNMMAGFFCIAIAPPGVVIVPFSNMIKADVKYSTLAVIAGYLMLLLIMPLMVFILKIPQGNAMILIMLMSIKLVVVPLIISRVAEFQSVSKIILPHSGKVINILFALIVYTVIGLNKSIIKENFESVILPTLILGFVLFGGGYAFGKVLSLTKLKSGVKGSLELIFNVKNTGFAAVLCLTLFSEEAAIPSAALSVVLLLYLISLSIKAKRQTEKPALESIV